MTNIRNQYWQALIIKSYIDKNGTCDSLSDRESTGAVNIACQNIELRYKFIFRVCLTKERRSAQIIFLPYWF